MKHMPPDKALRWSLKALLGIVRRIQVLADGPMPELADERRELSRVYRRLMERLEREEAKT